MSTTTNQESYLIWLFEWINKLFQRRSLKLDRKHVSDSDSLDAILQSYSNCDKPQFTSMCIQETFLLAIPQSIGSFKNLTNLSLSHNYLMDLPVSIVNLSNLKHFDLSHNLFMVLPPTVSCLISLTSLHLGHNQLKYLPVEILNLTKLKTLTVDGNEITSLTTEICRKGVKAIFETLMQLANRHNLWNGWSPNISNTGQSAVKPLVELSFKCIIDNDLNFLCSTSTPPPLKRELLSYKEVQEMRVMKCSKCRKYFSNAITFRAHICK